MLILMYITATALKKLFTPLRGNNFSYEHMLCSTILTAFRVMCVSFHKYGDYFPGTGALEDIGARAGKGYSVNVPLKDGVDDVTFEIVFKKV